MPILAFFVVLVIGLAVVFIVRLAMHPVDTLVGTVRLLSFLLAAGAWIGYFVSFSFSSGAAWELLVLGIIATGIWLLTFARR
ncbi:hypothetical protein KACC15558_27080 [Brevibacterium ammoniilyticum]|uniref:Uncharacterized protein n=1 Tax=Brevibacterium ammoniilyticum TaxID=1046555 RepID=A0ABP9U489_9MICO